MYFLRNRKLYILDNLLSFDTYRHSFIEQIQVLNLSISNLPKKKEYKPVFGLWLNFVLKKEIQNFSPS